MKKICLLFVGMFMCSSVTYAGGIGTFSTGQRMGQLTKFSVKGMMFKSGEGQMLMGSESTPLVVTSKDSDGRTVKKTINPWYFSSTDEKMQSLLDQNLGEYVVLEYKQARIKSPKTDTEYEILSLKPISAAVSEICEAKKFTDGSKSLGKRVGRIVKASAKGTLSKSWELIIQQGNSGNQFKHMSISKDEALYNCAIRYLEAGQKVKITYDESHFNTNVFGRDTNYDIIKLEPVKGLN